MSAEKLKIKTAPLPESRISVALEVPSEICKASYEDAISRLSRSIKLPGFRKGKIPRAVIVQQIGAEQIKASALEKLISDIWREAIKSESIQPLCEPEVKGGIDTLFKSFDPSQDITVTLETDIEPSPKLKRTQNLEAKAELIEFNPNQIDELIEQSRKQLATLIPIENRAAAIGDVAVVSFKGKYIDNGSNIEGGDADSMDIDLEKGKMIPGFIEGIVGMNINEEKNIKCKFPEDYPQKDSQGREATFLVSLKEIKTRELPKLDDSFAKQTSDKSSMKELKKDLEEKLKDDVRRKNISNRQEALLETLVKELEVELPKTLIDQEVRNLIEQTARRFADQGMDVQKLFTQELVQSLMESSRDEAIANLKRSLALKALAQAENIKVEEKEIENKAKELIKEIPSNQKIDQNRLKAAVTEDLMQTKLLEWLESNNNVIETSVPENNGKESKSSSKSKKTKSNSIKEND